MDLATELNLDAGAIKGTNIRDFDNYECAKQQGTAGQKSG